MTTQRIAALEGRVTDVMRHVAAYEGIEEQEVLELLASGKAAIPANPGHKSLEPRGIGGPFKVKVNANIGTSLACNDPEMELKKLELPTENSTMRSSSRKGGRFSSLTAVERSMLFRINWSAY